MNRPARWSDAHALGPRSSSVDCRLGGGVCISASRAHSEIRSPFADATAVQKQLRDVAGRAVLSVYAVTAFVDAPEDAMLYGAKVCGNDFSAVADRYARSCGSAFAIDAGGHLLTSEHVIRGSTSVWVTDDAGVVLPALVVASDPRSDFAVLYIPSKTQALPLAASPPSRGDFVITLGNPDGLATSGELAASTGCVSATNRSLPALSAREGRDYNGLIQVTTPIAVGGSGGPLVDLAGAAIGVVSAVATSDHDGQAVGFALPLSAAAQATIARLTRGEDHNGQRLVWAGVTFARADNAVRVESIALDATMPLDVGAIVRRVNGKAVRDLAGLLDALHASAGSPLTLDADER